MFCITHESRMSGCWGWESGRELVFVRHLDFLNEGTPIELCNLKCLQHQCRGFFFIQKSRNLKFCHVIGVPAGENRLFQRKIIIFDILLVRWTAFSTGRILKIALECLKNLNEKRWKNMLRTFSVKIRNFKKSAFYTRMLEGMVLTVDSFWTAKKSNVFWLLCRRKYQSEVPLRVCCQWSGHTCCPIKVSFTVCIAFTGNLQKYELADYFPIKRNILDLIFRSAS